MKIFISWSGGRSKAVALRLHEWLKTVVQRADPWMSDRDLEAGQRWNEEISHRLKDTHFGIICLTPENLQAPWLLFEAGALAKAVDAARVVPVLFGVPRANLTFPLAQFQAVDSDEAGLRSLASAVNTALGPERLEPMTLNNLFNALWADLRNALASIPAPGTGEADGLKRTDRQLLEDLVEGLNHVRRALPARGRGQREFESDSDDWEDYYIRGVNLANVRGDCETNLGALCAYGNAIALTPASVPANTRSRLYAYRGAILKRLRRLEEAEQDLVLAQRWAGEDREVEDALYNLACVKAMGNTPSDALPVLRRLIELNPEWAETVRRKPYFEKLSDNPEFVAMIQA
ncbi:MAG: toll/interleukin-1 receptor domain-containing protein [Acidobacteriota bacterium]